MIGGGILLWNLLVAGIYYTRFPLYLSLYFKGFTGQFTGNGINLAPVFLPFFGGLILTFSCWVAGSFLFSLLNIRRIPSPLSLTLQVLLGMFAISILSFFLGILGLLYSWIFIFITCFMLAAGVFRIIKKGPWKKYRPRKPDPGTLCLFAIFFLLALVCLMYTLTPPLQSDGLRYHLAAPQEYIKEHRIHSLPLSALSNSPFLIEMLFLYGILIFGDLTAKMMHFVLWFLSILLIRGFLLYLWRDRREGRGVFHPRFPALMGGLLFGSMPAVSILACWSFIDLGIAAFFLGFVIALVLSVETGEKGLLILCGLLGGAALGTKYTMLPMIFVGCVLLFLLRRKNEGALPVPLCSRFSDAFLVGAVSLAFALPWYIKSLVYTGNPFYPLLYGIFGGKNWSGANAVFYASKAAGKGFGKSIPLLFSSPFSSSFHWDRFGQFNPGPFFLLGFPFFLLSPLVLKGKELRRPLICLLVFSGIYYLMWFFGYQSNRFLIPFYGLEAVIVLLFVMELKKKYPVGARILAAGLFICLSYSSLWSVRWILTEARPHPLPAFLGIREREEYLTEALDYYPAMRALNEIVPREEAVLLIGEHRSYGFRPRLIFSDWFDTPAICHLIRETGDNRGIFSLLGEQNCTHVFYNNAELSRYHDQFFRPRFTREEYERYKDFLASPRLRPVYEKNNVYIFQIIEERKEGK